MPVECPQWTAAGRRLKIQIAMSVCKSGDNFLGAKNNDSLYEKWVVVIFYHLKNQKYGNPE